MTLDELIAICDAAMSADKHIELVRALNELWTTLDRKCRRLGIHNPIGERGTMVSQVIGSRDGDRLFIYEAGYRGTLWPRIVYRLHGLIGSTHADAVREARWAELRNRGALVALRDCRFAAETAQFRPEIHEAPISAGTWPHSVERLEDEIRHLRDLADRWEQRLNEVQTPKETR